MTTSMLADAAELERIDVILDDTPVIHGMLAAPREKPCEIVACVDTHAAPLSINAAPRDPATYEDPHRFDITRQATDSHAFGQDPHTCAIAELRTALTTFLRRLPACGCNAERPSAPAPPSRSTSHSGDRTN